MPSHFAPYGIDLPVNGRFCFEQCRIFLDRSPRECLHRVDGGAVLKAVRLGSRAVIFRMNGDHNGVRLEVLSGDGSAQERQGVSDYVAEWLDLQRDLRPFYRMAAGDALLQSLAERYAGLRLIGIPDLLEALCWAIIGQQINLQFAYTLKARLVALCGTRLTDGDQHFWLFPEAQAIAALSEADWGGLQFSRSKIAYLRGIAALFANGTISKEILLESGSALAIRERLLQIRGVGEWTADYVLMKCFRHPAALPAGDAGLQNALKTRLQLSVKPSPTQIREMFAAWKGWEAYTTFYLWRSLI